MLHGGACRSLSDHDPQTSQVAGLHGADGGMMLAIAL